MARGSGTKAPADKKAPSDKKAPADKKAAPADKSAKKPKEAHGSGTHAPAAAHGSGTKPVRGSGTKPEKGSKGSKKDRRTSSTMHKGAQKVLFKIDCTIPAADDIFDQDMMVGFEQYLKERIKVDGKTGNLGDKIKVWQENNVVNVQSYIKFSKRYLKYLTKRYLKKKTVRDWLRIIANGKNSYQLSYFKIYDAEDEEAEE